MNRQLWSRALQCVVRAARAASWKDWLTFASLSVIVMAAIAHARSYSGAIIDDAFITFRYSWNLVHGNGLTYNLGQRVEGTSSSLFAVLLALPLALGADPYRCAGWLGSVAFAACCLAAYFGCALACETSRRVPSRWAPQRSSLHLHSSRFTAKLGLKQYCMRA